MHALSVSHALSRVLGRRGSRFVCGAAVLAMTAGLTVATAPSAAAVACGGATQNGLSITPNHDSVFYTDLGDGFNAAYVGYQVTNSGASRTNLWVTATNFTGGIVTLADSTDDRRQISVLPAAASATRFFHARASALTTVPQAHTVTVYDRRPDLTGAIALASCDFSFSAVEHTIGANANKVTGISSTPTTPSIGGTVTVTVVGQTGQATGAVWISPAALSSWPSKALRLESTSISVNTNGIGPAEEFYTDTLFIPASIAALYTSQTTYEATYVFRVTRATATNPVVKPVAQIHSGGAFKHTGSYPTLPTIATSSASASVTVGKTITAADVTSLPTTTSPNGVAGSTTYVEVPYRIRATSTGNALVDEFVDVPAAGVLFKNGSALLTDATPYLAEPLPDPATSTTDPSTRTGALHFTGPFLATSTTPATITYSMYIPLTAGTYTNQAFATLGGTTIGASPSTIPYVSVTSNGSILTSWTSGLAGSGTTAQSIAFTQPADAALSAGTHSVSATASSGLPVAFTSSTSGVCTVSGATVNLTAVGTCTISAAQSGDATYAAAAAVTRSFAVTNQTPQTISFGQPGDVSADAGTRTVSATSSSGLIVAFTSTTPGVCTISGTTVTLVASGTCTISADQAGDGTYAAAPTITRSFTVTPAAQSITFAQPSDVSVSAGTRTVSATSSSGLIVAFTSTTPGVCTISGTTVTLVASGTCTISADQPGNTTYAAAPPVTRSFGVHALPAPPAPASVTSNGLGSGPQSTAVSVPPGGSVSLLDSTGTSASLVVVPGQGTYVLDAPTGTITFVPVDGFGGAATPVTYRVVDSYGQMGVGTYTPVVTLLTPAPPVPSGPANPHPAVAAPPAPPVTAEPILNPSSKSAQSATVVGSNGAVARGCELSAGYVEICEIALYAVVSGRRVVVGYGVSTVPADVDVRKVTVSVSLNSLGRALSARPGGTRFTTAVAVTVRGSGTVIVGQQRSTVVARSFVLARPVFFDSASHTIKSGDRAYLRTLRHQLAGVKSVTCIGYTDSRGSVAYDLALGKRRATATCRLLTHGTGVDVRVITRGESQPHATNLTRKGRALNRRATILLSY